MRLQGRTQNMLRGDISTLFSSIFQPDMILPEQAQHRKGGDALPPAARLFRRLIDEALHDLTNPAPWIRREALEWLCGRVHPGPYGWTFKECLERGYTERIDPEVIMGQVRAKFSGGRLDPRQFTKIRPEGHPRGRGAQGGVI